MNRSAALSTPSRGDFDRLLGEIRPRLHRYCARMTGSVIDGEDVVQEALVKALEAFTAPGAIDRPESWLFRIAHNAALDFLRRRSRREMNRADQDPEMMANPTETVPSREIAATSLRTFMRLPVAQRSSVILMDVLGYSLEDIAGMTSATTPAVKASLHRGRARLRELAAEPEDLPMPVLDPSEHRLLAAYIDRFNARDVDAIREMLADEVRLELVARHRLTGRAEVSKYFSNYAKLSDWQLVPGLVEGRAAALVRDGNAWAGEPAYFILLNWSVDGLVAIRDFRYARYAIEDAEVVVL